MQCVKLYQLSCMDCLQDHALLGCWTYGICVVENFVVPAVNVKVHAASSSNNYNIMTKSRKPGGQVIVYRDELKPRPVGQHLLKGAAQMRRTLAGSNHASANLPNMRSLRNR